MKLKVLNSKGIEKDFLVEYDAGYINPNQKENKLILESIKTDSPGAPYAPYPFLQYAILQKAGVENKNGRIYPMEVLEPEVKKYQTLLQDRSINEYNHPESSIIDLERVSHRIVKIWWEGNILMSQIEILTSPGFRNHGQVSCVGDHAALLLSYGITLGISSRGVGSLRNEHGKNIVQSDFELICFDLVSSPSTPGAYLFNDLTMRDKLPESIIKKNTGIITEIDNKIIKNLNEFLD
jgi:hypothetical protein